VPIPSRPAHPVRAVLLGWALFLSSCGEGRPAEWSVMYALEVREEGSVVATWTIWGGWDEPKLPDLPPAASTGPGEPTRTYSLAAYNLNGESIPFTGAPDHEIGYRLAEGEPTGVLDLERPPEDRYGGGEVHLFGAGPGTVRIEFTLLHGGGLRQATLPIPVTVAE